MCCRSSSAAGGNDVEVAHHSGGFDTWEAPVLYGLSAVALAFTGPGRLSLDHGRPWQRQGPVWGAGAVALGVGAALITLVVK
jgi:putative oxidoreductase